MSHFVCAVMIPKSTPVDEIEARVEALLAPFDENTEVPSYERPCYCVGGRARKEVRERIDAELGSVAALRETFKAAAHAAGLAPEAPEANEFDERAVPERVEEMEEFWKKHIKLSDRERLDAEYFNAHPLKGAPEPTCEECKGTGVDITTYNPKSKWDWWVVGGRWDGWIQGEDHNKGTNWERVYTAAARELQNNVLDATAFRKAVHASPASMTPFALVTPDGEWCQKGEMGWFGHASNAKPRGTWAEEVLEIVSKYLDSWVVACDLHI